jgi:hypothetical protein
MSEHKDFKDVHEFDYKIPHWISQRFDKVQKEIAFNRLLDHQLIKTDPATISAFKLITDKIEAPENYDCTNNVSADDILMEILQISTHIDTIILCLIEQMLDMATLGPCPQGRCGRLLQVYNAFKWSEIVLHIFPQFIENSNIINLQIIIF